MSNAPSQGCGCEHCRWWGKREATLAAELDALKAEITALKKEREDRIKKCALIREALDSIPSPSEMARKEDKPC